MRINFKFLAILVGVVILAGGALFGLNRFQAARSADILLTQAREARESEDIAEALRLYKQFLDFRPREVSVHEELGMLMVEVGQYQPAYFHLETALRANPQNVEAQEKLVEATIALGRNADAKTRLNEQLLPTDDQNPKYHWLLGLCESNLSNYAEARAHFETAVDAAPGEPRYVGALADLLTERFSDTSEARAKLDAMVTAASDDPICYFVRANWLLQQSGKQSSKSDLEQLLAQSWSDALRAHELDENDVRFVLLISQVAVARKEVTEARNIVANAIEANPRVAELYSSAAQLELADNDVESAIECFRRGLAVIPGQNDLTWGLAQLELDAGNIAAAEEAAKELRKRKYADTALSFLEARILVAKGEWRQAAELIESSRALMDQNRDLMKQADFLLAGCYQKMGRTDQEALALRRAVALDPLWLPARQALATSLMRSGRLGESMSELRQVVASPNAPPSALLSLARLMFLDQRDRDQADWTQLRSVLAALEQYPEAANDVAVIKAEVLVDEEKPAEAVQLLKNALRSSENKQGLWQALLGLQVRNEQWDEAEATLNAAAAALSDDVPLRLEQARFLISRDGREVDTARLEELATPDPSWTEEQKSQLAYGIAGYFLALEEYALCEKYAKIVADAEQGQTSLSVHLMLFDLALRSQDTAAMLDSLEQVKEIEGTGPLWRVGEAVRLTITAENLSDTEDAEKQRLYTQAKQQLAEAAVERPNWARIPRLLGDIYDRQGQTDQAVNSYLEAIELGEQNSEVISRAMSLLSAKGRFQDADKIVRKMQEQETPFSAELTRVASQVSLQLEDYERALSLSEDWAAESDKQEDHLWLAQVYSISGKTAEAEQEFRVAIDLDPGAPAPWVALVQMHSRANDVDAANKTIEEAKQKIRPEDADNAIAQCYESLQNFELAEKGYVKALGDDPDNPRLMIQLAALYLKSGGSERAQPLLERLVAGEVAAEEPDQLWARRNLALVLGSAGGEEEFERAKELIASNLSQAESEQDRRTLAMILASRPEKKYTNQATDILKKLIEGQERRTSTYQDKFMLAQLYLRQNDWSNYSSTMFSVLGQTAGRPDYIRYVRSYTEALLANGKDEEAKLWVDRLRKLAPEEMSTATSEAILLFRAKNYERLYTVLETKSEQPEYVGWAAELSENFARGLRAAGEESQAEKFLDFSKTLYATIAESEENGALILAAFHARQGSIDEMWKILASEQPTPDQLAEIAQTALQSGKLSDSQLKQLQAKLQQTFLQDTSEKNLGMCLGDLYSWGGDWRSAVATYRAVLKADPKHVPALNNMAMVLAMSGQQLDEAAKSISEAIRLSGPRDYLLDTRGIVLLASGANELAASDFSTAIDTAANGYRFFHRALAYQSMQRSTEAEADLKQAIEGGVAASTVHPLERNAFEKLAQQLLPVE